MTVLVYVHLKPVCVIILADRFRRAGRVVVRLLYKSEDFPLSNDTERHRSAEAKSG